MSTTPLPTGSHTDATARRHTATSDVVLPAGARPDFVRTDDDSGDADERQERASIEDVLRRAGVRFLWGSAAIGALLIAGPFLSAWALGDSVDPSTRDLLITMQWRRTAVAAVVQVVLAVVVAVPIQRALRRRADQSQRADEDGMARRMAREEFLAVAAHELRTPVTIVNGYAQLLNSPLGEIDPDSQREVIERLAAAGQRLHELTDRIQILLHARAGELPCTIERRELGGLLAEAYDLGGGWPDEVTGDRTIEVRVDVSHAERAIGAVVRNAVVHGGDAFRVEVLAGEGHVDVAFLDDGPGVAADVVDDLFTPFRSGGSHLGHGAGNGLGLALARAAAQAFGGDLSHEPTPSGARFVVRLPAAA